MNKLKNIIAIISVFCFIFDEATAINKDVVQYNTENWTSCETFVGNRSLNNSLLLDVDWRVFYFWCYDYEDSYNVKFSLPSPDLVRRFRDVLDADIFPMVEWEKAELFLETSVNFCGLLIRTEERGVYRLIPSGAFNLRDPEEISSVPMMTYSMKLVDKYLAIMNCEQRLCYAFAPNDDMPNNGQVNVAAQKIGFWNPFGRSYLVQPQASVTAAPLRSLDDADDDVQAEIDANNYIMTGNDAIDDE